MVQGAQGTGKNNMVWGAGLRQGARGGAGGARGKGRGGQGARGRRQGHTMLVTLAVEGGLLAFQGLRPVGALLALISFLHQQKQENLSVVAHWQPTAPCCWWQ